jgi:hypothetical protein
MMTAARPLQVAIAGAGPRAERWAAAFRAGGACDVTLPPADSADPLSDVLASQSVEAVVLPLTRPDLPGAIKRAVLARCHVLVAPAGVSARHAAAIEPLARWRRRLVMFDTPDLADPAFAFVRRLTSGSQPLWRIRYVRAAAGGTGTPLDESAVAQVARVVALCGEPERVSAIGCDDADGSRASAFLTLAFDAGLVARIDVSLLEAEPRDEIVVVAEGRTFTIDALAPQPLRIAGAMHRAPRPGDEWIETTVERPSQPSGDRLTAVAAAFAAAARAQDVAASNAREYAIAAAVWHAARESMNRDGEWVSLRDDERQRQPALQVIEGGGRRVAGSAAPVLTVIRPSSPPRREEAPRPA